MEIAKSRPSRRRTNTESSTLNKCPQLWSTRLEHVEWAADRRLTLVGQDAVSGEPRRCDKMSYQMKTTNKGRKTRPMISNIDRRTPRNTINSSHRSRTLIYLICIVIYLFIDWQPEFRTKNLLITPSAASLIIGDSAIEIQEIPDDQNSQQQLQQNSHNQLFDNNNNNNNNIRQEAPQFHEANGQVESSGQGPLGSPLNAANNDQLLSIEQVNQQQQDQTRPSEQYAGEQQQVSNNINQANRLPNGPLPSISKEEDITDGDRRSRANHDYDIHELQPAGPAEERRTLSDILADPNHDLSPMDEDNGKQIAGKVVDFELTPAGGHNKAKIKKKKKKQKKAQMEEAKAFKKWGKKHKSEKKAMEKKEKEHMKKKKEEGKKKKKKWGLDVHGMKKKGNFKKKKWGKKVKKGKGVKKGKKGKKFLKDKGHKNTGFKTVYHKEEWGKSAKWHDIKREKKWDEKSKKWKKKWKKEKGKKYKGDHMKKFEKQKKEGKKYKKAKKEQHKKFKKEKFEAGKKMKKEEHKKKKEGGMKKEMKEEKKKKKKKKL